MYSNQQIGAFSQRQYKNNVSRATNTPLDPSTLESEQTGVCRVTVSYNKTMGKVTYENLIDGSISVKRGDTVKLTATPNSGYKFVEWVGSVAIKKTLPTIDFIVNKDVDLEAVFTSENDGVQDVGGSGDSERPKKESDLISTVKKYWWVIAIILGYLILKEDKA